MAAKKRYTFVTPPARTAAAPARSRTGRVVIPTPPAPSLEQVLAGRFNGIPYGLPPREICEDCGATMGVAHGRDCYYAGYPTNIVDPAYRPTLAAELHVAPERCGVCRARGTAHAWWCSWWDAHPDAPAPF